MNFSYENTTLQERISTVIAGLLGLALIAWSIADFVDITNNGGSQLAIFANALFAFGKGIAGVILLGPTLTRWSLFPAFRLIDWIYSPGGYAKRPPLDYRLADYYRRMRQFESAVERYSEIVRYYPQEVSAHAWRYVILDQMAGPRKSRGALRHARRCLRKAGAIDQFQQLVEERKAEWR